MIDRIDNAIGLILQNEFNDLFKELTSYNVTLNYKFALLTDEHFTLYHDIHMQSESMKFPIANLDFVDLGIIIQNHKVNKRVFFFKAIYYNNIDKVREVFLFSVSEDQIYKWESCLDPSDDIQLPDRTFKLIKGRLLRQKQ